MARFMPPKILRMDAEPFTMLAPPQPPRLLDRVGEQIRMRHYSSRTEQAYVGWALRRAFPWQAPPGLYGGGRGGGDPVALGGAA